MTAGAKSLKERVRTLAQLFKLFEGPDAEEEIRRPKARDGGFGCVQPVPLRLPIESRFVGRL